MPTPPLDQPAAGRASDSESQGRALARPLTLPLLAGTVTPEAVHDGPALAVSHSCALPTGIEPRCLLVYALFGGKLGLVSIIA